jgi:predicted membrane protein
VKQIAIIAAAALALSGCNVPVSPTSITALVQEVQADAQRLCSFIPDAAPVEAIIEALAPSLSTPLAIATSICGALTATVGARYGGVVRVVTVMVNGKRVIVSGHRG